MFRILLMFLFSATMVAGEHTNDSLRERVESAQIREKCCMPGGFCGPTSFHMNASFLGTEVPASLIYNLGWNYGFHFDQFRDGSVIAWPTTYPREQLQHASDLLGLQMTIHTSSSLDEAKRKLLETVGGGTPAIVHWTPHLVLAYGKDGDKVLFHDPQDTTLTRQEGEGYRAMGIGKGPCQKEDPSQWDDPIRSWGTMGYPFYTLSKKRNFNPDNLDWQALWTRLADRTNGVPGKGGNVRIGGPNEKFGVPAMKAFATLLPELFIKNPGLYGEWGHLGYTARHQSQQFLFQQSRDPRFHKASSALEQAARAFGDSAALFRRAKQRAAQAWGPQADKAAIAKDLQEILRQIADVETEAAAALREAANRYEAR